MKQTNTSTLTLLITAIIIIVSGGCSKAYYGTMEMFGKHKRDILVDNVADARDAQNQAKEQFASALEEFMSNGDVDDNVAAIMFSDGVESCGGDPCARARQLQQKFPNLSVNILHLGPETYSSCIAEATGGKQYQLDDLAGLVADIRAMATVSTTQSECSLAEEAE